MPGDTIGQRTDGEPATQGHDAAATVAAAAAAATAGASGSTAAAQTQTQTPNTDIQKQLAELTQKHAQLEAQAVIDRETFEKRYTGLQTSLNLEQQAHATTKTAFTELSTKAADAIKQLEQLNGQKTTWEQEQAKFQTEVEALSKAQRRSRLIMEKFPDLAMFEINGVLPDAPDDKLEDVLGKFAVQVESMTKKAREDYASGGTRRPSKTEVPAPEDQAIEAARSKMNKAALSGNQKEYDLAYDELQKLQSSKKS